MVNNKGCGDELKKATNKSDDGATDSVDNGRVY